MKKRAVNMMNDIIKLIVDNGVTIVVLGYFMYMNYKFNEKLTMTLTKICDSLEVLSDGKKES